MTHTFWWFRTHISAISNCCLRIFVKSQTFGCNWALIQNFLHFPKHDSRGCNISKWLNKFIAILPTPWSILTCLSMVPSAQLIRVGCKEEVALVAVDALVANIKFTANAKRIMGRACSILRNSRLVHLWQEDDRVYNQGPLLALNLFDVAPHCTGEAGFSPTQSAQ